MVDKSTSAPAQDRWTNPETGRRYPKCDGCAQPIINQAEHDKVCGWSAVKLRSRF